MACDPALGNSDRVRHAVAMALRLPHILICGVFVRGEREWRPAAQRAIRGPSFIDK